MFLFGWKNFCLFLNEFTHTNIQRILSTVIHCHYVFSVFIRTSYLRFFISFYCNMCPKLRNSMCIKLKKKNHESTVLISFFLWSVSHTYIKMATASILFLFQQSFFFSFSKYYSGEQKEFIYYYLHFWWFLFNEPVFLFLVCTFR